MSDTEAQPRQHSPIITQPYVIYNHERALSSAESAFS